MFAGLPPPELFTAEVVTVPSAWRTDETGNAWLRLPDVDVTVEPTLETSLPTMVSAGVSMPLPPALPGGVAGGGPPLGGDAAGVKTPGGDTVDTGVENDASAAWVPPPPDGTAPVFD
jgi:hypothetical protein